MHSIDNVWACMNCVTERVRKQTLFNPPTEIANSQELNAQRGNFIANMNANDSILMNQDEIAKIYKNLNYSDLVNQSIQVPFVNLNQRNSFFSQQAANHFQRNSNQQYEYADNAANSKEDVDEKIKKLTSELESLRMQFSSKNNDASTQNENAANGATHRTQSTPINEDNRENEPRRVDINSSIQIAIEESMRKLNNESILQMSFMNQRMVEIQMNESLRNTHRVLPKVKNPDYEWIVFFQAFKESKHLFSDAENVARLQTAIECDKIKKSGGPNLFNPYTYWSTLEDLNKRIGKSENLLLNEKLKLINNLKVRNDDKTGLIELIENIKKYSTLVERLGSYADKTDLSVISRLSRLLPGGLKAKWSSEFSQLRELYNVVHIKQMSSWLDNQINTCETELYFDRMDPFGELKTKSIKKNYESKDFKRKDKNERLFNQTLDHESDYSSEDEEHEFLNFTKDEKQVKTNPATYCWFHKKSNHSVFNCFSLLNKTGEEVIKLAEKEGYCTRCAGKKHEKCSYNFNCIMPGCKLQHAAIFCNKREPVKTSSTTQSNHYNKNNEIANKQTAHSLQITNDKGDNITQNQEEIKSSSNQVEIESNFNTFNALYKDDVSSKNRNHINMIYDSESLNVCEDKNENKINVENNCVLENHVFKSLLPVVVVILKSEKKSLIGAFLLDTGSSVSIIDAHYASILDSEGVSKPLCIEWSGGKIREDNTSQIVKPLKNV